MGFKFDIFCPTMIRVGGEWEFESLKHFYIFKWGVGIVMRLIANLQGTYIRRQDSLKTTSRK